MGLEAVNGITLSADNLAGVSREASRSVGRPLGRVEAATSGKTAGELSEAEKRQVQRLKQRDAEVRNHERAHVAAGGPYVRGGANFQYQRGPDGRSYAVGGEVQIDVSPENTPEGTIRKMQVVRRAALAPADPSPQDRSVAARASQLETRARQEKSRQIEEGAGGEPRAAAAGDTFREPAFPPSMAASRYRATVAFQKPGDLLDRIG